VFVVNRDQYLGSLASMALHGKHVMSKAAQKVTPSRGSYLMYRILGSIRLRAWHSIHHFRKVKTSQHAARGILFRVIEEVQSSFIGRPLSADKDDRAPSRFSISGTFIWLILRGADPEFRKM
jgi:hypothetical protein